MKWREIYHGALLTFGGLALVAVVSGASEMMRDEELAQNNPPLIPESLLRESCLSPKSLDQVMARILGSEPCLKEKHSVKSEESHLTKNKADTI